MEHTATTPVRKDIHQQVTDTIIRQLEDGIIPWQRSWVSRLPQNGVTGNRYRGINTVLLWGAAADNQYTSNEWASYKQWGGKGEYIRKGERGNMIVYADAFEKEVDGEIKRIPFLKQSVVFNRCQLASYDQAEAETEKKPLVERIATVDDFIANTFAELRHHEGDAYYVPGEDKIYMPHPASFIDTAACSATENYYTVLLHELTHWTGHSKRLNRKIRNRFGNDAYAEEELVAELGAAFMTAEFDIVQPEKSDHSGYIASWLKVLKNNKQFITAAASEASKAVDFMKELQPLKF